MNQIKTGAVISYVALFLNIVIGLLYTPWMIRTIGKADYGLYTLAMSVISLFVFDFGLASAITRFVSKFLAEGRQDKVDNLLGLVFKLYGIGDAVILVGLVVVYFLIPSIYQGLTPEELEKFKVVYLIASLFCVISFPFLPLNGIITSYEKFVQLKSCDLAHKIIVVALMSVCLLMGAGLYALVIVNSVAGIIIIFLKLAVLGKTRIRSIRWRFWDKSLLLSVIGFSLWVTVIQLAQRCIFNLAPTILAVYETSAAVTILGIAITLEGYTFTFASAINGMFLPRVSRMVADESREGILELMTRIGRIQIYIVGLICIGFICVGREFIQLWLGEGFEEIYPCALMLILPSFLQLPQEIGNTAIVAENKVKFQGIAFIGMALFNLALAFPFTKMWGVKGLCLSIMIAYLFRTAALDYIYSKKLNINIMAFFRDSYLKILPALVASGALAFFVGSRITLGGISGFAVKTLCCAAIYFVFVWVLPMNGYEKDLLAAPFRKVLRKNR